MSKCFYTAKVLLPGLITAQIVATLQVHMSNTELFHTLVSIRNAGYLVVPNDRVMQRLLEWSTAFYGGLFFTLSVGAGLSFFTLAAAWMWDRLFSRKKIFLLLFLIPWTGLIVGMNLKGFCPTVTSYFLLIPIIVFAAALKWMPAQFGEMVWLNRVVHIIPIIALAFLWISQIDSNLFLDIRDNLLFSNSFGTKINDFYYKYTLYPAEVFKSLDQKILKTYSLAHINKKTVAGLLEYELLNHDFLHVKGNALADLTIVQQDDILSFENKGNMILKTPLKAFLSEPGNILRKFSLMTDKHDFFRHFTFFSLLTGFPAILYVVTYTIFCLILCAFLDSRLSSVISVILCLIAGIALLVFFHLGAGGGVEEKNLSETIESAHWQVKVAALKTIQQKRMDIASFETYKDILKNPHIPVRYWLARVLGDSRQPDNYQYLLVYLDDPCPNVVCMAFNSLGRRGKNQRGNKRIIKEIIKKIEASDHWYEQWYAYKALRILGWKQARSK